MSTPAHLPAHNPTSHSAPAEPIELVILDLDGTILDLYRPAPISKAVRDAIQAVQTKGIPVTIATGRTLDYVGRVVRTLGLGLPVVTGQGAVIGDPKTGTVLEEFALDWEPARRAAAWIDTQTYVTTFYFTATPETAAHFGASTIASTNSEPQPETGFPPTIHIYQNRLGNDAAFYDHIFGTPRSLATDFGALLARLPAPPLKFIVAEDVAQANSPDTTDSPGHDLVATLRAELGEGLSITRTHPRLVEGTAAGVDKGAGVRRLCARLGIDPARVLAIGDSDNDIPMLEAVGFGVGMGNASPGVRAVADALVPPIDQDGAAVALRRWVL